MLRHKPYGKQIRQIREARCWTQQRAHSAGYTLKTVWKAVFGRLVKLQTSTDLARVLQVQVQHRSQQWAASYISRQEIAVEIQIYGGRTAASTPQ